ncbi:hypothetical protein [Gordonibacter sp.]|uniref:hypothetical protein n=1 Tax=Gordonibacter sp. TaxID=1968902 RepID=UPI002FC8101E
MQHEKKARPAVGSKGRANDRKVQQSVTPWTPSVQIGLVAVWVVWSIIACLILLFCK